ncbi:hypothetical protein BG015_002143 [Linnemannia schmuckeri]|uniref:Uncharacterized protein n=1 Tax=Linnemannia schmuckeri TaxID=64567 RepID=A0A9P5S3K2_9FUNG|nr:hypothetical protein BG015_002143 [Linnemannia schmuckeri]
MPLPNPWTGDDYEDGFPVTLITELTMMAVSNTIREKPNWWLKYQDPEISARWRQEIEAAGLERHERYRLGKAEVDFVFKELEWYAQKRQAQVDQGREVTIDVGVEGTRRADGLVPEGLKRRLMECVKKLEDVPEHLKDWHPGSDHQVLDLVHPSLFPFIAGRTRVTKEEALPALKSIGSGEVMHKAPNPRKMQKMYLSEKFQWLPTDFDISPEGKVKAKSYINNLHPEEHKDIYPVLEEIFEKFLPMFEEVVGEMAVFENKAKKLSADPYDWYPEPPEAGSDEDEDEVHDAYYESRVPKPLEIPEFTAPTDVPKYDLKNTGKPLQVIVKLANIELTPENPKYEGGTWHVEGMANENIVASGIYYYHTENISDSRLNFRIQVQEPGYEQSDDNGVRHMYDLWNDGPLVQYLDGVVTKQDRCLVFPNIYQHQVQPFTLDDTTKPGSRKILVFFLVNPEEPVLSTTNVPPQQKAWATEDYMKVVAQKLPPELVHEIDLLVDWPMELEEAKKHREELMKERKFFVKTMEEEVFARPFSLCEH